MGVEQEHVESECQEEEDYVHLFDSDFVPRERSYSHEWSVTVLGSIFIILSCIPLVVSCIIVFDVMQSSPAETGAYVISWGMVVYYLVSILATGCCIIGSMKQINRLLSFGLFIMCLVLVLEVIAFILIVVEVGDAIIEYTYDITQLSIPVLQFFRLLTMLFLVYYSFKRLGFLQNNSNHSVDSYSYELAETSEKEIV